jgi:hypothetical protein
MDRARELEERVASLVDRVERALPQSGDIGHVPDASQPA